MKGKLVKKRTVFGSPVKSARTYGRVIFAKL